MENLTGGTPPVRPLPCVVPCKLYFIVAVIFIGYCFLHPEAGSVFYIREFRVGSAEMNVVYGIYAVTTVMIFCLSFVKKN